MSLRRALEGRAVSLPPLLPASPSAGRDARGSGLVGLPEVTSREAREVWARWTAASISPDLKRDEVGGAMS